MTERERENRLADPPMPPDQAAQFRGLDVVVVLPTLNEEAGLARTLDEIPFDALRGAGWSSRPLIIDGGSTDGTRGIAAARGVPVLEQRSRGKGAAIREALQWLAELGVRYAVILDADCTYPGSAVPAVVQLLDAGSQLVVGVRQPDRPPHDDAREFVHRIGNRVLNITASQLSGLPILDLCSGFWGVAVAAVPPLKLETDGFEIESELFTKSYRAGYTVTQIPIAYRERAGVAKLHAVRDGARILLTTLRFGRRALASTFALPTPSQLRDLLSIAMIQGSDDFLLLIDEARRGEAEAIAARIRACRPAARVAIQLPSTSGTPAIDRRVDITRSSPAPPFPPVTIALRSRSSADAGADPSTVIVLPRTRRIVALRPKDLAVAPTADLAQSGAVATSPSDYWLEYAPVRWPAVDRVRATIANTFPTTSHKELAFLGANGHYGALAVWRSDAPRTPRASIAFVPSTPGPAASTGVVGKGST